MSFVTYVAVHISTEGQHTHLLVTFDMIHKKSSINTAFKSNAQSSYFQFLLKIPNLTYLPKPYPDVLPPRYLTKSPHNSRVEHLLLEAINNGILKDLFLYVPPYETANC